MERKCPSKYLSSSVYSLPRVCGVAALSAERLEILVEVCAVDDRVDAAVEHRRQQHDVRHQGPHLHTVQWQHDGSSFAFGSNQVLRAILQSDPIVSIIIA